MRSPTFIACDRSSKVMFSILSFIFVSMYSTKPHMFKTLTFKQKNYISKGRHVGSYQDIWTMLGVVIAQKENEAQSNLETQCLTKCERFECVKPHNISHYINLEGIYLIFIHLDTIFVYQKNNTELSLQ